MDCRSRQAAPGPSQARVITRTRGARSSPPGREPSGRRSGVGRRVGGGKATTPVAGSPSEASESSVRAGLVREALTSSSRAGPSWEHLSMKGTPAGEAALIDVRSAEAVLAPAATLGFTRGRRGRDWGVRGGIASLRSRSTTPRRDGAARCGAPSQGGVDDSPEALGPSSNGPLLDIGAARCRCARIVRTTSVRIEGRLQKSVRSTFSPLLEVSREASRGGAE
jgi:hypothetical protein